jgi:hypothetical protein
MKEKTKGAIAVGIIVACWLLIYDLMVRGLNLGSVSDILIRRCLFVFVLAFVAAAVNVFYGRERFTFGPFKYTWFGGLLLAAVAELGGVWKIVSLSRTTQRPSEVYGEWLSQWWIILIALSLGTLGGYLGNRLIGKLRIRWEKQSSASEGEY